MVKANGLGKLASGGVAIRALGLRELDQITR
jgi:hypothetical protein